MAEAKTATIEVEGNGLGKGVCLDNTGSAFSPYRRLATQLDDAERLLVYAAETGREMDPKIGDAVLNARNVSADKWDKPIAVGVLSALTSLIGRHGERHATMILLAYRHGLRVSELIRLRWDQLNLDQGLLHVRRVKNGVPSTHPLTGSEIRALLKLKRLAGASA